MVGDVPTAALENHLRQRINASNGMVSTRAGYLGLVARKGNIFLKFCVAFGTGEIIAWHIILRLILLSLFSTLKNTRLALKAHKPCI